MKKFRIVGLLLVLCLISSSFVGVTFAKYTSTASGSDNAVVAKWEIEAMGSEISVATAPTLLFNLFQYINEDDTSTTENNVKAGKILAPGTGGYFQFSILNKSEVDAEYTVVLEETVTNTTKDLYIQYSLDKATWYDDFTAINVELTEVAIGKEIGTATLTIYWRWAFNDTDVAADGTNAHTGQNNANDTALGIVAQTAAPKITIKATITVSQVD